MQKHAKILSVLLNPEIKTNKHLGRLPKATNVHIWSVKALCSLVLLVEKCKEAECCEAKTTVQGRTRAVALDRAIYHPETDDFVGESSRRLKFVLPRPLSSRKFIAPNPPTSHIIATPLK